MQGIPRVALSSLAVLAGSGQANADAPASLDVRTMTFNIRNGRADDGEDSWPHRREQAAAVIRHDAPAVVGLQEAFRSQLDDLTADLPAYGEVGIGRDGGTKGEYSSILYRKETLSATESGTFWLSETPDHPSKSWDTGCVRICTWAHFRDRRTGLQFYVYNTHLDHRSQLAREKGVLCIASFVASRGDADPFVVMGDFNAGEDNAVLEVLTGQKKDTAMPIRVVDTFRHAHPDEKEAGTYHAFKGRTDGAKIDYILVPPGVKTVAAAIIRSSRNGRYPSDHFPVTATIRFPAAQPAE
jgi:endonuclease/exonuclease/phosphatase family metal-dependent hydrolase